MKIKNFDFWYRTAKRFSLLLLSSIFLFGGVMHAQNVNMSRYITLNVAKDSLISIRLATDAANTPVRIVSGDSVYDFTTTSTSVTDATSYVAGANTMTIYGDVKRFDCYRNKTKITGIDVSKNTALRTLNCGYNKLTSLDISQNVALCTLRCYDNQLTSLDVSKNTALTYFDCGTNQLTSLDVSQNTALTDLSCGGNQLTSLDVSKNTALTSLSCYSNQLTSLDVSKNTALTDFSCGGNQLTSLDVSKNTALTDLRCYSNQLTSLDLSKNTALTSLYCYKNQLTSLDVSKNLALRTLSCYGNQLTNLDVSKNTALITLYCYTNQLTSLDLSKNTALTDLACYGNPFTTAEYDSLMCSLPLVSSGIGSFRPLYNSSDTNATKFAASNSLNAKAKNWNVQYYSGGAEIPATTGNYDCSGANMNRYITLNVTKDSLISIDLSADNNNTPIKIVSGTWDTTIIADVAYTGNINYFAGANTMTIYGDVKGFNCSDNDSNIIGLDASHNTALTELVCTNNNLTTLDVSACTNLEWLICYDNKLTTLDVSGCSSLEKLYCSYNNLTSLDVSTCTALISLECNNNKFSTAGYDSLMCSLPSKNVLNIARFYPLSDENDANSSIFLATNASNATAKNWVIRYQAPNFLGSIPATTGTYQCPSVNISRYITLNVAKDSLISIDLSADNNNTPIKIVSGTWDTTIIAGVASTGEINYYAGANTMTIYGDVKDFRCNANKTKITGIDVSNNIALCTLSCYDNNISALDISKNTALKTLNCNNNQLTSLDLSQNTALIYLSCVWNQLTSIDVSQNVALCTLNCSYNQLKSLDISKNTALIALYCYGNQLTSLDVSKNTALTYLSCYSNPFTTAEYDAIMCSLPFVSSGTGSFRPLYNSSDTNATKFAASNSLNAKAKNWNVPYNSNATAIPATTGNYDCSGANMNRYIKLNVAKESVITLNWTTDSANTPVKIVSGDSVYEFTMTSVGWIGNKSCYAADDTMYVYGNVKYFSCSNNAKKITGVDISNNLGLTNFQCTGDSLSAIDVSKNTALTYLHCGGNQLTSLDLSKNTALIALYCYGNQLTSLDVSKNTALKTLNCNNNQLTSLDLSKNVALCTLYCYRNPFTIAEYDNIMCSLPSRSASDNARFYPLYDANDANSTIFLATNASNATAKNWQVIYSSGGGTIPATSGNYDCNGVNMGRYIILNVAKDSLININLSAEVDNTSIRIMSGDSIYNITASTNWIGKTNYFAHAETMVIYGNIKSFDCNENNTKITGLNVSNNPTLTSLYCNDNALTSLIVDGCSILDTLTCNNNNLNSLDISTCSSLQILYCSNNNLSTLDVSTCNAIHAINCSNNELTSLNVVGCTVLKKLTCTENALTILDLSSCIALNTLSCYGNNFTIKGYDSLMCSLPSKSSNDNAKFYPLYDANDINATKFMASNAQNVIDKNWQVNYLGDVKIPSTSGTYDCDGVNMGRYIILNVAKDSLIRLNFIADNANTFVRIVSSSWDTIIKVDTRWIGYIYYFAYTDTITIYGNVQQFDCRENNSNIIKLDASHNTELIALYCYANTLTSLNVSNNPSLKWLSCYENALTSLDISSCSSLENLDCGKNNLTSLDVNNCKSLVSLYCYSNAIRTLDIRNNTEIEWLSCYENALTSLDISNNKKLIFLAMMFNPFSTGAYDTLMCLLPTIHSNSSAMFFPLMDKSDSAGSIFATTNSNNAKAKGWQVIYYADYYTQADTISSTIGTFNCDGTIPEEDTTSISEINISNIELYPNPANSMLTIKNATANVQIFDITGREIMHVENKGEALLQINVSNLSKGMYFVKVGNYTTKFVKE